MTLSAKREVLARLVKEHGGPESPPTKAASSAKLGGSWMVVTVGVWLVT